MYEVFLNERKIVIAQPGNITFVKEAVITEKLNSPEDVKIWFANFVNAKNQLAILVHPSPDLFWNKCFKPAFNLIPAAGGIVLRNGKLLFIRRNEKWDLPKGKIEHSESAEDAALREVEEECGIKGHCITKTLPSTFHIFQSPYEKTAGLWILKETFWFEMSYTGSSPGTPETKENITEIKWIEKKEIGEVLANTYENLKTIISLFG